jgi:hypothetical protein
VSDHLPLPLDVPVLKLSDDSVDRSAESDSSMEPENPFGDRRAPKKRSADPMTLKNVRVINNPGFSFPSREGEETITMAEEGATEDRRKRRGKMRQIG